jgi:hypothetical protein
LSPYCPHIAVRIDSWSHAFQEIHTLFDISKRYVKHIKSKKRSQMSVLKGRIHHAAEGIGDGVAAAGIAAVAATGVVAAVVITGATAGVAGAVGVAVSGAIAGAVSDGVSHKTRKYENAISDAAKKTWQRRGFGFLATFTLACGIGAGVLVHKHAPKNDNAMQSTQPAKIAATNIFNIQAGDKVECSVAVKNGTVEMLSGPCEVRPALK